MDLRLSGKRAFVSGSTAGIGLAIAERLAVEGAEVVVSGRTEARVAAAVRHVEGAVKGAKVWGVAADLGTAEGARVVIERVPDVDVLVNNVGVFEPKAFAEIDDAGWERMWQTNVMSGVRLSRYHLPRMLKRNSGRVVFISSESAMNIPAEMIHYGVSKTAQAAVARGMAELTVGSEVTVNTILAGPTRSEGVGVFVRQLAASQGLAEGEVEKDFFKTARPTSLLQRFARVEEVADVVAFVASPLASAINGAALRVEGGLVRSVF